MNISIVYFNSVSSTKCYLYVYNSQFHVSSFMCHPVLVYLMASFSISVKLHSVEQYYSTSPIYRSVVVNILGYFSRGPTFEFLTVDRLF
jgi:hypothetical protein